jgi:hypothetical protein
MANQAHTTTAARASPPSGTANLASTTTAVRAPPPPSLSSTEVCDASTAASLHGASSRVGTTAVTNVVEIPADDSKNLLPNQPLLPLPIQMWMIQIKKTGCNI